MRDNVIQSKRDICGKKCDHFTFSFVYIVGGTKLNSLEVRKADFEVVYDRYADMLYRLALSHLQRREDAEDAVQEVFAKYLDMAGRLKGAEHERAWLIRVTVNVCHDLQRKKKYRMHVPLEEIQELANHKPEELPDVFGMVAGLRQKYKTVMVLHYLEGYSIAEIASIIRISGSAVKMRLSRGRELL